MLGPKPLLAAKFQLPIIFAGMACLFLGNPVFGCEERFHSLNVNTTPFSLPSPSWFPSGFVGHPNISNFEGRKIVILPLDFTGCYLSMDEPPREIPEWSELGRIHLQKSIKEYLEKKKFRTPNVLSLNELTGHQQRNLQEARLLFDVLHINARRPFPKPSEKELTDYSLGKETADLFYSAEIFVLVNGHYHVNSPGRNAFAIWQGSMSHLYFATTSVTIGLIEASSGNLIWLKHEVVSNDAFDLRKREDTDRFVTYLMREFLF